MEGTSKTYETRQKRKSEEPVPKSKVDWKRTKIDTVSHVLDSDESASTSEEEEEDDIGSTSGEEIEGRLEVSGGTADDGEDVIRRPGRKNASLLESSDSGSDSDVPGAGSRVRRCRAIEEDDDPLDKANGEGSSGEDEAQVKKQKRKDNLKQLAERRRSKNQRGGWKSDEASSSSECIPLSLETMDEDEDSQDMDDFIEYDEEKDDQRDEDGNQPSRYQNLFLRHKIPQFTCNNISTHLQKVIKAFLINIADNSFLETLYEGEREKRYAKDLLKSLNYLDGRLLAPRLEKLTTSCRWKPRYKDRVNCYPKLQMRQIKAEKQACDACELFRCCTCVVTLSGQAYDGDTLEIDDFLPEDKQWLVVGKTCGRRTGVYHRVKHYKFHLYQRCIPFIQKCDQRPAKEMVEMALSNMEEQKFIQGEVDRLQTYLEEAETFQDETEESLIS